MSSVTSLTVLAACVNGGLSEANIDLSGANSKITLDVGETEPLEVTSAFLRGLISKIEALETNQAQLQNNLTNLVKITSPKVILGTYSVTTASRDALISDNAGPIKLEPFNEPPISGVFSVDTDGLQLHRSGNLFYMGSQDYRTTEANSYVSLTVNQNGVALGHALATNSNAKYDQLTHIHTTSVKAGDKMSLKFTANADLTAFDKDTWSQHSFIWFSDTIEFDSAPQVSTWAMTNSNSAESVVVPLSVKHTTDSTLFVADSSGVKIKRAGQLFIAVEQDIRSSGSTSYATLKIQKNGGDMSLNLVTHTNGYWDSISGVMTTDVEIDDVISFWYGGGDITGMDNSVWSHYSFLWIPPNANSAMCTLYPSLASRDAVLTDATTWLKMVFKHNGNSNIFSVSGDEITVAKAGQVMIKVEQDLITDSACPYASLAVYHWYPAYGAYPRAHGLLSGTNGQWDMLKVSTTFAIDSGDKIKFQIAASTGCDIQAMDYSSWAQYSIVWFGD